MVLWQHDPVAHVGDGLVALAAVAEAIGVLDQLHTTLVAALNSTTT